MEILFLTLPVMAFLVIIVTTVAFFAARFKRCPSDMILVVTARSARANPRCVSTGEQNSFFRCCKTTDHVLGAPDNSHSSQRRTVSAEHSHQCAEHVYGRHQH